VSGTSIAGVSGDGTGEQNASPTWPTLPSLLGGASDRSSIVFESRTEHHIHIA